MKPESVQTLMPAKRNREPRTGMPSALDKDTVVIPLSSEDVVVERRDVETGVVSVSTATTNHQHVIGEGPTCERVEIERVPFEIYVDSFPEIRTEGDTMILPVVEEVMVRRLLLREEARIRTIKTTERHQYTVTLREQEAVITRRPAPKEPNMAKTSKPITCTKKMRMTTQQLQSVFGDDRVQSMISVKIAFRA